MIRRVLVTAREVAAAVTSTAEGEEEDQVVYRRKAGPAGGTSREGVPPMGSGQRLRHRLA